MTKKIIIAISRCVCKYLDCFCTKKSECCKKALLRLKGLSHYRKATIGAGCKSELV